MSKIFVTSDTHFNHKNILEYCPNRKYGSLEEMNGDMLRIWNETVAPEDTVYFVGDFAMGPKDQHIVFLNSLHGFIRIVPGNHDRYIVKLAKQGLLPPHVELLPEIYNLRISNTYYILCHFPIHEWEGMAGHRSDAIAGSIHLHGHTHGNLGKKSAPDRERYDIGWDVFGKPIELNGTLPGN